MKCKKIRRLGAAKRPSLKGQNLILDTVQDSLVDTLVVSFIGLVAAVALTLTVRESAKQPQHMIFIVCAAQYAVAEL